METSNLFFPLPNAIPDEVCEALVQTEHFTLERIVSAGQATPAGEWYDQDTHEWVILLSGRAHLLFEHETHVQTLQPGDYVLIPAHCRHRVEWTDPTQQTVWLALHYH
jgi:cupin 2 domain-containing protein